MKVQYCLPARPHPIADVMGLDASVSRYALLQYSGTMPCADSHARLHASSRDVSCGMC